MTRSSSPFDAEAVAELEAKLARKKEKQRQWELEQEKLRRTQPKVLVAESPSPRKKRKQMEMLSEQSRASSSSNRPKYFDSTLLGPPPPINQALFKPEASISITRRESKESKFSSHESAMPKSFLEKLQSEQAAAKLDQVRRQRVQQRSTGFSLPASSSKGKEKERADPAKIGGLMKARKGTDLKVKPKIKQSSQIDQEILGTTSKVDIKPVIPAMSRPKSTTTIRKGEEDREEELVVRKRRPFPSASSRVGSDDEDDDGLEITDGPSREQEKRRRRNKDSTVIEDLEMGPIDFVPPKHDPNFNSIEPNSGIKLRERLIPHEQVQGLLSDRYHLTPSQIYSLARIDQRRQVHIDVDADFVIIGVLAWKDEIRFLNSNPLAPERKETPDQIKRRQLQEKRSNNDPLMKEVLPEEAKPSIELFGRPTKKQRKQRYIRFEMVDLSTTQSAASGTGTLNVMLVESDSVDQGFDEDGNEVPIYKGQSGGAYEKYWKESPGAVVAIINPSFLPASEGRSHTLKPISADSMVVLGRAKDLTFCDAIRKKDGQKCNAWVDSRVGTKCQYHIHLAVSRTGMGRAETFGNTASLKQTASINMSKLQNSLKSSNNSSSSSLRKKPLPLDPSIPNSVIVQGHTTYVSGGSRSTSSSTSSSSTLLKPSDLSQLTAGGIGLPTSRGSGGFIPGVRDGPVVSEEKKKKEREKLDRERARKELKELGKRDRGVSVGGEYLRAAKALNEAERKKRKREEEKDRSQGKNKTKSEKQKKRSRDESGSDHSDSEGQDGSDSEDGEDGDGEGKIKKKGKNQERKKIFSSEAVRMIGYNPALKPGDLSNDKNEDDETLQQRLALEGGVRQAIKLTAPPGRRVVSGVMIDPETVPAKKNKKKSIPPTFSTQTSVVTREENDPDDDDDDDDLLIEGAPTERIKLPVPPPRF
ncbi:hypothetical protein JCM5350_006106 [Sporobolomyces pararoseus]